MTQGGRLSRALAFGLADLNSRCRQVIERAAARQSPAEQMLFASAEAAVDAFETAHTSQAGKSASL